MTELNAQIEKALSSKNLVEIDGWSETHTTPHEADGSMFSVWENESDSDILIFLQDGPEENSYSFYDREDKASYHR